MVGGHNQSAGVVQGQGRILAVQGKPGRLTGIAQGNVQLRRTMPFINWHAGCREPFETQRTLQLRYQCRLITQLHRLF